MHRICRFCAAVGVAILLGCALLTVTDVLTRRLIGFTIPGLIDLTQLLVMSSVFLCIPFAFERRANVEVDLLFVRLPAAVRRVLGAVWALLGAAFLLTVAWHVSRAAAQVIEYGESSPTIALPMIWYWVPILFGTLLAAAVCLQQVLRRPHHQQDLPIS
jgi:TRAP-type C4-dicarboxylate transport system permease small subunit